jgi:hypothetical protein
MEACRAGPGTCADDPSRYEPTPHDHTGPLRRSGRDDDAALTSHRRGRETVTERHGDDRHRPGNATNRRRNVSSSKRICARTETTHPGESIRTEKRATVPAMLGSPAPIADTVTVSPHTAEHYRHRVKQGLDRDAPRGELERPRATGKISAREPAWLHAANPTPCYLLIGGAIVLPLLAQAGGWVTTTYVTQRTLTPTRRDAQSTRTATRAARKRAQRRTRC